MSVCGDNSCIFGPPKGLGTNGGCRCLKDIPFKRRVQIEREVARLKAAVQAEREARGELEKVVDEYLAEWDAPIRDATMTFSLRKRLRAIRARSEEDASDG